MSATFPMSRPLLILDLDETLLFAHETPLSRVPDFKFFHFHVYRRPYVTEFLSQAADWFELAVWSSASPDYVAGMVGWLFGTHHHLRFIWASNKCTVRMDSERCDRVFVKNLSKIKRLGFSLERTLILDDSPEKLPRHYGNHVPIAPFTGNPDDEELRNILPFLESLRVLQNVRHVEKRYWRQRLTVVPPTHSNGEAGSAPIENHQ